MQVCVDIAVIYKALCIIMVKMVLSLQLMLN